MGSARPVQAFPAPVVEAVCRVLAETMTGAQIPNLIAPLGVKEVAGEDRNTKWMSPASWMGPL